MGITYKDAGVDVTAGYQAVKLMREHVSKTFDENVLKGIGSFGGFYSIAPFKFEEPVLVAGTDGVGTKLKIAFMLDKHDTIGQDCVAMCVNDIACQGAKPLLFLDYIATAKLEPEKIASIVKGVADGCVLAGCALIGGETAEMPGFYTKDEYDIAGFSVGIADKKRIIDGSAIKEGSVLIGVKSSGVHSNGYSLVRRLAIEEKNRLGEYVDELSMTVGEALLRPTHIYSSMMYNIATTLNIQGMAHITGGGFIENIPRMLPEGLAARVRLGSWDMDPIFPLLAKWAGTGVDELYNTFNMGIGLVVAVAGEDCDATCAAIKAGGFEPFVIGDVVKNTGKEVEFI
ncbi:MAG: phosphoribosylformylglycinamidine cyclo-ligase [Clostridiales bacterium]|nr:phosphoribosylformylglycinamidine cyclo-ligase [Clostridiales bacterium]